MEEEKHPVLPHSMGETSLPRHRASTRYACARAPADRSGVGRALSFLVSRRAVSTSHDWLGMREEKLFLDPDSLFLDLDSSASCMVITPQQPLMPYHTPSPPLLHNPLTAACHSATEEAGGQRAGAQRPTGATGTPAQASGRGKQSKPLRRTSASQPASDARRLRALAPYKH